MKWEYRQTKDTLRVDLIKHLNAMGEWGWELVEKESVIDTTLASNDGSYSVSYTIIFKRLKE